MFDIDTSPSISPLQRETAINPFAGTKLAIMSDICTVSCVWNGDEAEVGKYSMSNKALILGRHAIYLPTFLQLVREYLGRAAPLTANSQKQLT